jgi:hypothetical protein
MQLIRAIVGVPSVGSRLPSLLSAVVLHLTRFGVQCSPSALTRSGAAGGNQGWTQTRVIYVLSARLLACRHDVNRELRDDGRSAATL